MLYWLIVFIVGLAQLHSRAHQELSKPRKKKKPLMVNREYEDMIAKYIGGVGT